jgi:hypothetical protein
MVTGYIRGQSKPKCRHRRQEIPLPSLWKTSQLSQNSSQLITRRFHTPAKTVIGTLTIKQFYRNKFRLLPINLRDMN